MKKLFAILTAVLFATVLSAQFTSAPIKLIDGNGNRTDINPFGVGNNFYWGTNACGAVGFYAIGCATPADGNGIYSGDGTVNDAGGAQVTNNTGIIIDGAGTFDVDVLNVTCCGTANISILSTTNTCCSTATFTLGAVASPCTCTNTVTTTVKAEAYCCSTSTLELFSFGACVSPCCGNSTVHIKADTPNNCSSFVTIEALSCNRKAQIKMDTTGCNPSLNLKSECGMLIENNFCNSDLIIRNGACGDDVLVEVLCNNNKFDVQVGGTDRRLTVAECGLFRVCNDLQIESGASQVAEFGNRCHDITFNSSGATITTTSNENITLSSDSSINLTAADVSTISVTGACQTLTLSADAGNDTIVLGCSIVATTDTFDLNGDLDFDSLTLGITGSGVIVSPNMLDSTTIFTGCSTQTADVVSWDFAANIVGIPDHTGRDINYRFSGIATGSGFGGTDFDSHRVIDVVRSNSALTLGDGYGMYINQPTGDSCTAITNSYGIYIEDQQRSLGTSTNNWGIYSNANIEVAAGSQFIGNGSGLTNIIPSGTMIREHEDDDATEESVTSNFPVVTTLSQTQAGSPFTAVAADYMVTWTFDITNDKKAAPMVWAVEIDTGGGWTLVEEAFQASDPDIPSSTGAPDDDDYQYVHGGKTVALPAGLVGYRIVFGRHPDSPQGEVYIRNKEIDFIKITP